MYTAILNGRTIATYPGHVTYEQVLRSVERYAFRMMRSGKLRGFRIDIRHAAHGHVASITDDT